MDADGESYQSSIVTSCESFLRCTKSPLNRRKPQNNNIFFTFCYHGVAHLIVFVNFSTDRLQCGRWRDLLEDGRLSI